VRLLWHRGGTYLTRSYADGCRCSLGVLAKRRTWCAKKGASEVSANDGRAEPRCAKTNSVGLGTYWKPEDSGALVTA